MLVTLLALALLVHWLLTLCDVAALRNDFQKTTKIVILIVAIAYMLLVIYGIAPSMYRG